MIRSARWMRVAVLLLLGSTVAAAGPEETRLCISPDGLETAVCRCRPATEAESQDLAVSPDGWIQDTPRESYSRGTVPLPLVPDWVGARVRAAGGLAWGDADNDGDLDLFVGTYYGNMYPPLEDYYNFIYLSSGGMLEDTPSWISPDQKHTTDVRWGYLNDDPYLDLFVANGGTSLQPSQVFYGQDGLLPMSAGWQSNDNCWTIGSALCDFDSDGDLDVATANQGYYPDYYRPVHLFRNHGDGLETAPSWQSAQVGITNAASWGDMNGDSLPDLAVSGWADWQTGVFLNTGTSLETGFAWTTGHPERTDKGIGWAHVDGDPYPDLAVGGNGDPDWLFANEGTLLGADPVWESTDAFTGCQELVWIDIDRDGDEDLATIHFSTGHARIHLNNNGSLSTIADWQYDATSSGTAIAFGDVNDDGWPDLALGVANGPIHLFLNTMTPEGAPETAADLPRNSLPRLTASPNPFREGIGVSLEAGEPFRIDRIEVFDLEGRSVAFVEPSTEGLRRTHTAVWEPGDSRAGGLAPGIYFLRATIRHGNARSITAGSKIVWLGM